ncbi:protealysin inhibitor emfourin [Streptomyces sp. NPDC127069]|uniref:protealysin inhibitor emfourin n=1 Tax=unclassified Streptomyces TaxID=2593676 RepID=UPI00364F6DA4
MKVTLETYGGLAAAVRRRPQALDTSTLPETDAAELTRLVTTAEATPPPTGSDGLARDAMTYAITVEDNGGTTVLEQSDPTMTPAFAALLRWLKTHSAPR